MIHYTLRCDNGHEFDGWFKDSAAFDRQAKRGLVECPGCGATRVSRALMAPAIGAGARRKGRRDPVGAGPAPPSAWASSHADHSDSTASRASLCSCHAGHHTGS